ncbi:MAG: TonB-dependent receptor, partial [Gammaproteobacteria bacterium]|nr:TonB-dependent receptor [Gammaproteobacteria bacterium]
NGDIIPLANLSIGAHGFAGFSPQQAGTWKRKNYAVYVDAEADITENFTLGAAVRFEDFDDFGTTTNGKIAARLAFTETFAVRGSVSTGFRAPTPGQSNVTKVSTTTIDGELQQRDQIPPTNQIAMALGAEQLEPEDATNFTFGAVWDVTDRLNVTVDYYNIELTDRIAQTGTIVISDFNSTDPQFAGINCPNTKAAMGDLSLCLQETGIPGAADLNSVSFYTNDFETTTQGVDIVATWALPYSGDHSGDLTFAWNWTETEVDNAGEEVDRNRVVDLENFNPQHRGVITYQHYIGDFRFLARASYYDDWVNADFSDDATPAGANGAGYTISCVIGDDDCYDAEWIFDLEAGYSFTDNWSVVIGAMNIADEFGPFDKENLDANGNFDLNTIGSGNTYAQSTPFGQDGGFWYLRVRADFD